MRHTITLFALLAFACTSWVHAQNPVPVLKKGDVEKFIKTLKPMSKELEAVGVNFDARQNQNMSDALQANARVMSIFKKYGWDESYSAKWMAITMGYAKLKMEEQMKNVPAAQREQAMQMMKMAGDQMGGAVADKDLELIRSKYDALNTMMENYDK